MVAGLCLALIFIAGELALEWMGFGSPPMVTLNPGVSYELQPGQSIVRRWPLSEDSVSHVKTNRMGLRSDEIGPAPAPGVLRIFFVGDSITYGTTQVDQDHIFTELVHHELPAILHQPVEVMNASIGGWAIENELEFVKEHGIAGASRVILCLNSSDPTQPKAIYSNGLGMRTSPYAWPGGYRELYARVLSPMAFRLLRATGLHWSALHEVASDPGMTVANDAAALRHNLALLDQFQSYVQASHGSFSILYIPFIAEVANPSIADQGREGLKAWASTHRVPLLHVRGMYGSTRLTDYTLRDHTHFNRKGNRVVADAIEQGWNTLTGVQP